jgi:uncharacterized protein (DUF488 family)
VVEIWTLGHSNHGPDKFLGLLKDHKINVLVDVRSKPSSRFAHFQRDQLLKLVGNQGVKYLFGGLALGGMSNYGPLDKLFVDKMDTVIGLASTSRVAMMCSEGKPCECHRAGKLTAWLHRERKQVKTTHILPNGSLVDARAYEPTVIKAVRWPAFTFGKDAFSDAQGNLAL